MFRLQRVHVRRPASSGQALVEFALVFPVFILMLLGFIVLCIASWDRQAFYAAAREGAAAGASAVGSVASRFAADTRLVTPYYKGVTDEIFGTDGHDPCDRKSANEYVNLRGWDWYLDKVGCLYDPLSGAPAADSDLAVPAPDDKGITLPVSGDTRSRYALDTPLYLAAETALARIHQIYLGPLSDQLRIDACYTVVDKYGVAFCAYLLEINGDAGAVIGPTIAGSSGGGAAPGLYDAPHYISVVVTGPIIEMPFNLGSLPIKGSGVSSVDRFLPSCPAPDKIPAPDKTDPPDPCMQMQ